MENKFKYSYSAPTELERKEIEQIKRQYEKPDEKIIKMQRLRKLDGIVRNIPQTIALILGLVGVFIFGFGLTLILEWQQLLWGIIVCIIGVVPISFAYFVYLKLDKKLRDKYSNEIIKISNELLNEDE